MPRLLGCFWTVQSLCRLTKIPTQSNESNESNGSNRPQSNRLWRGGIVLGEAECGEDGGDEAWVVGGEGVACLGVVWLAEGHLMADEGVEFVGALAFEDGTGLAGAEGAADDEFGRGFEVDGGAVGVDVVHIVEVAGGAAASGDDEVFLVWEVVEHLLFEFAEGFFAVALEEEGYGGVEHGLEELVEVEALAAQPLGELVSDDGLAAIHVAYEEDVHLRRRLVALCLAAAFSSVVTRVPSGMVTLALPAKMPKAPATLL